MGKWVLILAVILIVLYFFYKKDGVQAVAAAGGHVSHTQAGQPSQTVSTVPFYGTASIGSAQSVTLSQAQLAALPGYHAGQTTAPAPHVPTTQEKYDALAPTLRLFLSDNNQKISNTGFALFQKYSWINPVQPTKKQRAEVKAYMDDFVKDINSGIDADSFFSSCTWSWPSTSKTLTVDFTIRATRKQTFLSDYNYWKLHKSGYPHMHG